jgi:hypothetical protein
MTGEVVTCGGVKVLVVPAEGPALGSEAAALDLISAAYGLDVEMIAAPIARLGDDFFKLSNGIAGAFIQKIRNYQYHLAIIGDISGHVSASRALHDFVYECNKRKDVVFAPNLEALAACLQGSTKLQ